MSPPDAGGIFTEEGGTMLHREAVETDEVK